MDAELALLQTNNSNNNKLIYKAPQGRNFRSTESRQFEFTHKVFTFDPWLVTSQGKSAGQRLTSWPLNYATNHVIKQCNLVWAYIGI